MTLPALRGINHYSMVLIMVQQSMFYPEQWRASGMIFLIGSIQGAVDDMIENRKNPLYERITAKITVLDCDSSEIVDFYRSNKLMGSPRKMLFLHSLFGGQLFPRHLAAQGLPFLQPTIWIQTLSLRGAVPRSTHRSLRLFTTRNGREI